MDSSTLLQTLDPYVWKQQLLYDSVSNFILQLPRPTKTQCNTFGRDAYSTVSTLATIMGQTPLHLFGQTIWGFSLFKPDLRSCSQKIELLYDVEAVERAKRYFANVVDGLVAQGRLPRPAATKILGGLDEQLEFVYLSYYSTFIVYRSLSSEQYSIVEEEVFKTSLAWMQHCGSKVACFRFLANLATSLVSDPKFKINCYDNPVSVLGVGFVDGLVVDLIKLEDGQGDNLAKVVDIITTILPTTRILTEYLVELQVSSRCRGPVQVYKDRLLRADRKCIKGRDTFLAFKHAALSRIIQLSTEVVPEYKRFSFILKRDFKLSNQNRIMANQKAIPGHTTSDGLDYIKEYIPEDGSVLTTVTSSSIGSENALSDNSVSTLTSLDSTWQSTRSPIEFETVPSDRKRQRFDDLSISSGGHEDQGIETQVQVHGPQPDHISISSSSEQSSSSDENVLVTKVQQEVYRPPPELPDDDSLSISTNDLNYNGIIQAPPLFDISKLQHRDDSLLCRKEDGSADVSSVVLRLTKKLTLNETKKYLEETRAGSVELGNQKLGPQFHRKSIWSLGRKTWLNDEVINLFLAGLMKRYADLSQTAPSVYYYQTNFFQKFLTEEGKLDFWSVSGYDKNVDIFGLDRLIVPVNHAGVHWFLLVAYMQQRRIRVYDSLASPRKIYLRAFIKYLRYAHVNRKEKAMCDWKDWQLEETDIRSTPQQRNTYDCGLFTCMAAECAFRDAPLLYQQRQMDVFRSRMALTILENGGQLDL